MSRTHFKDTLKCSFYVSQSSNNNSFDNDNNANKNSLLDTPAYKTKRNGRSDLRSAGQRENSTTNTTTNTNNNNNNNNDN